MKTRGALTLCCTRHLHIASLLFLTGPHPCLLVVLRGSSQALRLYDEQQDPEVLKFLVSLCLVPDHIVCTTPSRHDAYHCRMPGSPPAYALPSSRIPIGACGAQKCFSRQEPCETTLAGELLSQLETRVGPLELLESLPPGKIVPGLKGHVLASLKEFRVQVRMGRKGMGGSAWGNKSKLRLRQMLK